VRRHRVRAIALAGVMCLGAMLTACGSTMGSATPTARHATAPPLTSEISREATDPDPNFDYGYTVQITAGGYHPHWLVAACCQAITWRNMTRTNVEVIFSALLVTSGPIAPGGTWTYTPNNDESIAYQTKNDPAMAGIVQVNQTSE